MATQVSIFVFRGNRTELLPAMCMYCGCPLAENDFQAVRAPIGDSLYSTLALPICPNERLPAVVYPDGHSHGIDGLAHHSAVAAAAGELGLALHLAASVAANIQRRLESIQAVFTFDHVDDQFAQELERMRHLSATEYDQILAKSNAAFLARMQHDEPTAEQEGDVRRQKEQQEAEDEAAFQLEKAAGTGDVSKAETRASSRKLILISVMAGAVGLLLVMCITVGVVGYTLYAEQKAKPEAKVKTDPPPPKETQAKIKVIEPERSTITLLDKFSKRTTYRIDKSTEFFDHAGNRMPQGIADPKIQVDEYCVILPTQDRAALQWLKLTLAPK